MVKDFLKYSPFHVQQIDTFDIILKNPVIYLSDNESGGGLDGQVVLKLKSPLQHIRAIDFRFTGGVIIKWTKEDVSYYPNNVINLLLEEK